MKKLCFVFIFATCFSFLATASNYATMIISVNKTVPFEEIEDALRHLNYEDFTTGLESFEAKVNEYVDLSDPDFDEYWGVAIVDIRWSENSYPSLLDWIDIIDKNPDYTIYSNGVLGPNPIVSGGSKNN